MSSQTVRLATIGTGNIARAHRRTLADLQSKGLGDFAITAVCDAHEEAAQYAAEDAEALFGLRPAIYTDYQELLRKEKVDAADLCLPLGLHHVVTIDCLEAGVPVLCEKPLGITVKAARNMAETAQRTGCLLSTAHQSRRQAGQRAAHWALNQGGLIGQPLTFFHQYAASPWQPPAEGPGSAKSNVPPLTLPYLREPRQETMEQRRFFSGNVPVMSCGVHYFDSMRYFLGEIDSISAETRQLASGRFQRLDQAIEDAVWATITFKSGVVGTWGYWLAAPGEASTNVIFYGSEGSLRDLSSGRYRCWCHLFAPDARVEASDDGRLTRRDGETLSWDEIKRRYLATLSAEEREQLFPGGLTNAMAVELWEFLEAVRGNRARIEVDGWEGLQAVAAALTLYESAWSGQPVRVADVLSGKVADYQAAIDDYWKL